MNINRALFSQNSATTMPNSFVRNSWTHEKTASGVGRTGMEDTSVLGSSQSYGDSLRIQRQQAKDTSLQLKKLKYQFKNMSVRIMRSKTSTAARQVVSQAKREVLRLKREKQTGNYDSEEIDAAIEHAKAMERIARKKVKHLEEEELAKAAGTPCGDCEIEEEEDKIFSENDLQTMEETGEEAGEDMIAEADRQMMEETAREATEEMMTEMFAELTEDMTAEMMEEFSQSMQELLSEMGLDELAESMSVVSRDMDPADLKMLKIKHRNKELKEIVEADAAYLKVVFDRMEKERKGDVVSMGSATGSSGGGIATGATAGTSVFPGIPAIGSQTPESTINVVL